MKIKLPLPPRDAKNRQRQEYIQRCYVEAEYYPPEKEGMTQTLGKATITATIYHTHTIGRDAVMARLGWGVGWLVRNLWITDDDPDHLQWTGIPKQVRCKKDKRRVEFTLEKA